MAPTVDPQVEHEGLLARPVAEIGIERGDEGILARQDGFLEFLKVAPALFQRRRTIAQEGSALKRKRGVQGAICVGGRHSFCSWRSLGASFRKIDPLDTV